MYSGVSCYEVICEMLASRLVIIVAHKFGSDSFPRLLSTIFRCLGI